MSCWRQVSDPSKYGVVVMDEQNRVERFVEKPQVRARAAFPALFEGGRLCVLRPVLKLGGVALPSRTHTQALPRSHSPSLARERAACCRRLWATRSMRASTACRPASWTASSRGPPPSRRRCVRGGRALLWGKVGRHTALHGCSIHLLPSRSSSPTPHPCTPSLTPPSPSAASADLPRGGS